jgi:PAS domain S-box-containing protein
MPERSWFARLAPRSSLIAGYVSALLVLVVGVLIYRSTHLTVDAYDTVVQTHQLLDAVRQVDEDVQKTESEQRDYLITGDDAAFTAYNESLDAGVTSLERLRTLANSNLLYTTRVDTFVYFARLRLAELGEASRVRREEGFEAAQAFVRTDRGEYAMQQIRRLSALLYSDIGATGLQALSDVRREQWVAAVMVIIGILAAAWLVVLTMALYRRQAREQERMYAELEDQSFALQLQAAELEAANAELEGTTRDMVRQTAEAEANQLRLSGILESATDAIISFDDDKQIVYVNAAAERMFDIDADQIIGSGIMTLIPERLREQFASYIAAARFDLPGGSQDVRRREVLALRADGTELPAEASIAYAQAGQQGLYTAIMRDVSQRRQVEEQLRQSQKMEAVGRLAGGIAHDFNNLLTVISASSDFLLQDQSPDPESIREDVIEIRRATDRAAGLTRQLLAFSRRQIVQPQLLDLNSVVAEMEIMLRRLIGEDVRLDTSYTDNLGIIRIDRGQLEQVIVNLVVNARDAMLDGGRIEITTSSAPATMHTAIAAEADPRYGFVVLSVRDTGTGMNRDTQARIFEPFFTTKEQGKGTGLGLPTVYGIIKQAGGDVVVQSEPGRGSEFLLYFPRVETEPVTEQTALHTTADPLGGTETILVVEDEEAVRRLAHRILESRGYTVLDASNGQEAIDVMAGTERHIDMIVSDVVMPVMGGRELVERLLPVYPLLRVLFMTGYTEDTLLQHRIAEFGITVLEKPFTPESLARAVRMTLDRGYGRRPSVVEIRTA